jgi:glutamate/tyrosine decarboxylase-like PLP-dependent enzyme
MVRSDGRGRMDPEDLEAQILKVKAEGGKPFFVGATSGTTVLGAYDPLEEIAEICKRHGLWMHVDGCWGGAVLFSEKHRYNMQGVELADSVCWNPHKMIGSCLQCSVFLTKHAGLLSKTNSTNAAYLFMKDKLYAEMDVGDKTIQCGRHGDQLKMWMMFKSLGDAGIRHTVDHCFALAAHFTKQIRSDTTSAWQLVYEPSCANVCFWYVPQQLRPFNFETATKEQTEAIHKVAPLIKREMQKLGDAMIGFQALNGRPNFFRIVFCSKNELRDADIEALVQRMGKIGDRVSQDILL